jgi:Ca-activated chloride channel homolog
MMAAVAGTVHSRTHPVRHRLVAHTLATLLAVGTLTIAAGGQAPVSIHVVAVRNYAGAAVFRSCDPKRGPVREEPFPGPELMSAAARELPGLPDPELLKKVQDRVGHAKNARLAPSLEAADLVLVVQTTTVALFTATTPPFTGGRTTLPPTSLAPMPRPDDAGKPPDAWAWSSPTGPSNPGAPRGIIGGGALDSPGMSPTSVLAFAVPASAYRRSHEPEELLQAAVWFGWDRPSALAPLLDDFLRPEPRTHRPELPSNLNVPKDRLPRVLPWANDVLCASAMPKRAPSVSADSTVAARLPEPVSPRAGDSRPTAAGGLRSFKSGVVMVGVPVVVSTAAGYPVRDVASTEFRIFEDDVEHPVREMLTDDSPLNLVLVIDSSRSMSPRFDALRGAAASFVEAIRPDDRVMVVSFNDRAYVGTEFTSDRGEIHRAILQARLSGGTSRLYDTLDAVLTERLQGLSGRQAIMLLSDGLDVGSGWATARSTLERLQSQNAAVYALRYDAARDGGVTVLPKDSSVNVAGRSSTSREAAERAQTYLGELAAWSGGRVENAGPASEILEGFRQIADELRRQYVLFYEPPDAAARRAGVGASKVHTIRVEVARPGVTVRSRRAVR